MTLQNFHLVFSTAKMNNMTNMTFKQNRSSEDDLIIHSPPIVAQFYLWGYLILFIRGFTGNIASLLTFTRPTLRSVSTGTIFIYIYENELLFNIFNFKIK